MRSVTPSERAREDSRLIWRAYAALLGLLALTMAVGAVDLGWGNVVANMSIAAIKTGIILWIYMHLRESGPVVRFFAIAALLWLSFLIIFGLGDWLTRTTSNYG